mgnify:CR=1 FL=1
MLTSSLIFAALGAGPAEASPVGLVGEAQVPDSYEGEAVHPGRGPHRHPRRPGPHPRKRRFHRFKHGGAFGATTMVTAGMLYGDHTPWFGLHVAGEGRTSPRSSTAVSLGVMAQGEEPAYIDVGFQGRYYASGNFEGGLFVGATGSLSVDESGENGLVRFGPMGGYKQILPGGLTVEARFVGEMMPLEDRAILLYGAHIGLGASM